VNPRTTGILLLVAALLGAFVYFYEIRGGQQRQAAEEREKRLFAELDPEAIDWLVLTTSDGQRVRAERREGSWRLVEPLEAPGDAFALNGIASALAELSSEASYPDPQPLEVYGLADAAHDVRFGSGETEHALRTGDAAPMGGNHYAMIVGEPTVYTVASWRTNALRKRLDDLRDKRILSFDANAVERLVASWPQGRVALLRGKEGWRLTAPVEAAADAEVVENLLSDLSFLRAEGFEDEPTPDAESGLESPAFRVELQLAPAEEGAEGRRLELSIGSRVVDDKRLARAAEPWLYRIAEARVDDLPRRVVDYRFKRLAEFSESDAQRVELAFAAPGGDRFTLTATREEDGWRAVPEGLAGDKIARLVEELSVLHADDILAEQVGPAELEGLGLDPPNARLRVYGAGEDPELLADVRLGALRDDGGVTAQSGGSPQLFELDAALAEQLPVSLEAFRNRFLSPPEEQAEEGAAEPAPASGAPP